MDQQLSEALELHRKGEAAQASSYTSMFKAGQTSVSRFSQCFSIWRSEENGTINRMPQRGIEFYPNEAGLWNNLANCHLILRL